MTDEHDNEIEDIESPEPAKSDDRIDRVESKLDALIDTVSKIVAGTGDASAGASASADTPTKDDDPAEIPPQIDIPEATRRAIKPERGPAPGHFLFKRLRGRA